MKLDVNKIKYLDVDVVLKNSSERESNFLPENVQVMAFNAENRMKALIISNMVPSIPDYIKYANDVLAPKLDPSVGMRCSHPLKIFVSIR